MKLIPDTIVQHIPMLGATQHQMDPIVYAKLYDPSDDNTILLTEYNPATGMGYGWMEPIFEGNGLAHVDVRELENTGIECDPTLAAETPIRSGSGLVEPTVTAGRRTADRATAGSKNRLTLLSMLLNGLFPTTDQCRRWWLDNQLPFVDETLSQPLPDLIVSLLSR